LFVGPAVLFSCSDSSTGDDEDDTPPSAISDLFVVDFTSSLVTLSWTAPGNDGILNMVEMAFRAYDP